MTIARTAGVFYLLTFVTGAASLVLGSSMVVANAVAGASYVVVTVLFYVIFARVNATLSLIAAVFSLVGCSVGALNAFHITLVPVNPLAFFGVYCLLIGFLIYQSGFFPRALGVLMIVAGMSWLTFAVPALARAIAPFNFLPGIVAEGLLTLWLLLARVDVKPRADAAV